MAWRLAKSLEVLRDQINQAYPNRSKASDGTIGDAAHQATQSDHNPDSNGVVAAIDITHDPSHGMDANQVCEALRQSRDPRIKYVIFNRRTFDVRGGNWEWQPYTGTNPHDKHMHVSVNKSNYDQTQKWNIDMATTIENPYVNAGDVVNAFRNMIGREPAQGDLDYIKTPKTWNRQGNYRGYFYDLISHPEFKSAAKYFEAVNGQKAAEAEVEKLKARIKELEGGQNVEAALQLIGKVMLGTK